MGQMRWVCGWQIYRVQPVDLQHRGGCYHAPEIKSVVGPDGIAEDFGRESVTLISIHGAILAIWAS
jgi:hypothetical protein